MRIEGGFPPKNVEQVDFNKEKVRKLEEEQEIQKIAQHYAEIYEMGEKDIQESGRNSTLTKEDARTVAEAVFKAKKEAKNMTVKQLEAALWAAEQTAKAYEKALYEKDPNNASIPPDYDPQYSY